MMIFLAIALITLIFIVIFQVAKASEYVATIRGEKVAARQSNKINGTLMLLFMIAGFIGIWYCNKLFFHKTLLAVPAASKQGEKVDEMIWITLIVTGLVFIITQFLLFFFAYKYQEKENKKPFYFAHSNKLELIWTTVPAIALAILITIGLKNWSYFTSAAPKDALEVEVIGKQFSWIFRYKGADNKFGEKYYKEISGTNILGLIWKDKATQDDIITEQTMYAVKNRPLKLIIGSRDVVHDVGLPHFRLKMDAVPGIPTTLWLTPTYTTQEMKKITNNPNFQYEISCDQMCGNGHYSMKGTIEVVTQEEYDKWLATKKSAYQLLFPPEAPKVDSAVTAKLK